MPRLRTPCRGILPITALLLLACGEDAGTGPAAGIDLAGQWTMTVSPVATFGRTCSMPPFTLSFTNTNGALTGTMNPGGNGTMTCTGSTVGVEINQLPGLTAFDDIRITGSRVVFTIDGDPVGGQGNGGWTITGDIESSSRLVGTVIAFRIPFSDQQTYLTATGTWTAQRQ